MLLGYVTPWPLVVIRDLCHGSERTTLFRELKPDLSIWFGSLSGWWATSWIYCTLRNPSWVLSSGRSLCITICNFCSSSGHCQHTGSSVVLSASWFHRNIHGSIPEPFSCSVSSLLLHRSTNFQSKKKENQRERKKGLVHWTVGSIGICILHPWKLNCTQLTFIWSILVSQSGSKLLEDDL